MSSVVGTIQLNLNLQQTKGLEDYFFPYLIMASTMTINISEMLSPSFTPDGLFQLKRKIGWGSEGQVYEGIHTSTRNVVAVKLMHPTANKPKAMSSSINHPGIVKTIFIKSEGRCRYEIMEKCDRDVFSAILSSPQKRLNELESWRIFVQIIDALRACHEKRIYHGDIKPENILLLSDQVKLADFFYDIETSYVPQALTRQLSVFEQRLGSRQYLAPELLVIPVDASDETLIAGDLWALGLTLFVMVAGYKPWQSATSSDPKYRKFQEDPCSVWPDWFSKDLRCLLSLMLHNDPLQRISLMEVWNHPWVKMTSSVPILPEYTVTVRPLSIHCHHIGDDMPPPPPPQNVVHTPDASSDMSRSLSPARKRLRETSF
eukprot:gene7325-14941_t